MKITFPDNDGKFILGINYNGVHDTAVGLVGLNGAVVFACALERLSRVKQDGRCPDALIKDLLWERIEAVAISTDAFPWSPIDPRSVLHPQPLTSPRTDFLKHDAPFYELVRGLPAETTFVCHYLSHAASGFWPSGFEEALCLIYDGGMNNSPWFGGLYRARRKDGIEPLDRFTSSNYAKITSLYSGVTGLLGFTPNKHEGKITGLAAYGQPTPRCRAILDQLFTTDYLQMESLSEWFHAYSKTTPPILAANPVRKEKLLRRFGSIPKEEIAATLQAMTEEHVIAILQRARERGWTSDCICLSGGLFANVKVNQRIKEFGFRSVFVSPPMTDDGTAVGAALAVASCRKGFAPSRATSMFWGPDFSTDDIEATLKHYKLRYRREHDPVRFIAEQLSQGRVVGVFQGRMEFGPRALGNRSILSQATDPEINKVLNARLRRTEFMPFAPITRIEDIHECYQGLDGSEHTAEFMTITCRCTYKMRQESPAVVHVDGTARPQIVRADVHPFLHAILTEYKRRTGIASLINTSFNVHEEPIVCSPSDAIRGFLETGIDQLYLDGGFTVCFEENVAVAFDVVRNRLAQPTAKELQLAAETLGALTANAELEQVAKERQLTLSRTYEEAAALREETATIHEEAAAIHEEAADLRRRAEERAHKIDELTAIIKERDRCIEEHEVRAHKIDELTAIIKERDRCIEEHEVRNARIVELDRTLTELQSSLNAIRFAAQIVMIAIRVHTVLLLQPRLGVLRQHPPRPLKHPPNWSFPPGATVPPPKISIVTPSLNHGRYLERTMRSVLEQNYPNFEYVVQDGGSSDGSLDILDKYRDSLKHWESARDKGQAHAINLGFRHADGEIMAYLNSDDFFFPGTLAYIAEYFSLHPEVDVVYGHRVIVDEEDREVGRWVMPPHDNEVLSWMDYVPQETLFWRRRIWDKVGGQIDESFQFAMDWDLILRFREAGAKFVRLPRFLAAFRVHPLQKTSAQINDIGALEMSRLRRRYLGRTVTHGEAMSAAAPYVIRHIFYDKLSRFMTV